MGTFVRAHERYRRRCPARVVVRFVRCCARRFVRRGPPACGGRASSTCTVFCFRVSETSMTTVYCTVSVSACTMQLVLTDYMVQLLQYCNTAVRGGGWSSTSP